MVYTDGLHLIADSPEELHKFAKSIGMKREWFQGNPRHPHYDLMSKRTKTAAHKEGAVKKSSKELVTILHHLIKEGRP